jgi:S-adenosylmethionine-diacylglycerol 3-amino-3-carboxypropyl transferase
LDAWVVDRLRGDVRVIMVASGGCTASLLGAHPKVTWLRLVDPNAAQLALSRLKLRLLATCEPAERMALLGRSPLRSEERRNRLATELDALGFAADVLGPPALVAEQGPDHVGRYERLFAELRARLEDQASAIDALLGSSDVAEQRRRVAPEGGLWKRIREALDEVMAAQNLSRLFGEDAIANSVEPFASHFARRIRHVLGTLPAAGNPYLHQMLRGRDPEGTTVPWLTEPIPGRLPCLDWSCASMAHALAESRASFDVVHLSNILDWLSPEAAGATLALAHQALRPGGWTIVRQLNSRLDVRALGPGFDWRSREADALLAQDRSFFYRELHLGRKA